MFAKVIGFGLSLFYGSTDRTDELVLQIRQRGVKLFRQEGRRGKTYTQNKAVEQAGGQSNLVRKIRREKFGQCFCHRSATVML